MSEAEVSIYIVDDDPSVREGVAGLIRSAGMKAETFASAQEFLAKPRPRGSGCLVLDVRLPGISGLDLQQKLVRADDQIPIIFLTGHGDIPMSVRAIKAGAVEFLTKPFDDDALLEAIRRVAARERKASHVPHVPSLPRRENLKAFPPFLLDSVNQCLWRQGEGADDERILLAPKAFAMLSYLIEHAGRLVTQDELLQALWPETYVQPEVLKSHVRDIRAALGDDPKHPKFIETHPRRGYQFIAPVSERHEEGRAPDSEELRLVGRGQDLDRLSAYRQRVVRSERQLIFITGEPGIGKTSLADAFQRQCAAEIPDLRIARGQCVESFGGQEPYYPVLEAIGQLCHGAGENFVMQILATHAPTWLIQFPGLLKREQRDRLQREILGAGRERMLRELSAALETITAEKPLLLVFEDLQWADNSTVDLLSALARGRNPARLLIVGTYRPVDVLLADHPLRAVKQDLLIHRLCHEIALEPLTESQIAEFLAMERPGAKAPEGLADLLFRHSEGNPLFMVAALEHMKARGVIGEEGSDWSLKAPSDGINVEVPESLRQMIETQIDRLREEKRRLLEAASVAGMTFSLELAATSTDLDLELCETLCERLAHRQKIIRPLGVNLCPETGASHNYEFVHALYREVLYDRQPPRRRAMLHLRIGEQLEEKYKSRPGETAAELAHHFENAGDWARTIKYLTLASVVAGQRFEPVRAIAILEHALEVAKRPQPDRVTNELDLLERMGNIYLSTYDPQCIQVYQMIAEKAAAHGLLDAEIRALHRIAMPLAWSSPDKYLETVDRALQLSAGQDPAAQQETETLCLLHRLGARWTHQDAEKGREIYTRLSQRLENCSLESLASWCFFHFNCSQYREGYRCATVGFAALVKESQANPYLSTSYRLYRHITPLMLLYLGQWGEALRQAEAAAAAERNNSADYARVLTINVAQIYFCARDFAAAYELWEWVLAAPLVPFIRRRCQLWSGCAEAGRGNLENALQLLEAVRDDMDRSSALPDWIDRLSLQWGLTQCWLGKGDLQQAKAEASRFRDVALATEDHTWRALACEASARVAVAEGDPAAARQFIQNAVEEECGFEIPVAAWQVHGTAWEVYELLGESEVAAQHRELSRAIITELANSMPPEEPLRAKFLSAKEVRKILGPKELGDGPTPEAQAEPLTT